MDFLTHKKIFAFSSTTTGGGLWWFLESVRQYGPGWSTVPPLLFAVGGLITACGSFLGMRQDLRRKQDDNRRAEEIHRLTVARLKAGLDKPEALSARN